MRLLRWIKLLNELPAQPRFYLNLAFANTSTPLLTDELRRYGQIAGRHPGAAGKRRAHRRVDAEVPGQSRRAQKAVLRPTNRREK